MNSNALLRELAIVIGEMDPKIVDTVLKKLEEKNELFRIDFEILMHDLANAGEIKIEI